MASSGEIIYSKKWESKKIGPDNTIYGAGSPQDTFESIALPSALNSYKTHKVDTQILTLTFEYQVDPSQDTQQVTHTIQATEFETLEGLVECFKELIGVTAKIEDNTLIVESQTAFAISENEPGGMIGALGLHPATDE